MTDHSQDNSGAPDEPDGGWETGPALVDTQILTIVLCRFTGNKPTDNACEVREQRLHPDEPCLTLYHQAEALRAGVINYELAAEEVTMPAAGNDPIYQNPIG